MKHYQFSLRTLLVYGLLVAGSFGLLHFSRTSSSAIRGSLAFAVGLALLCASIAIPVGFAGWGSRGAFVAAFIGPLSAVIFTLIASWLLLR